MQKVQPMDKEQKGILKRGLCALCRLTELKTRYIEEKLQYYNKFELNKEIKLIGRKLLQSENLSDHYSDDVSSLDDPDDDNYVPETPVRTGKEKKRISLTQSITSEKSPTESKKGQKRKPSKSTTLPEEAVQKKPKKTVIDKLHYLGSEETDAPEQVKKWFVTVKRNWEGIPNYFPSSSKFDIYVPPSIGESCKENWLERVELRKIEISNKVKEIFGDKDAVILVPYSGRIRMSFPCPEHDCSFSSVDIKKHLMGKHKWSKEQSRLQTSYNHTMFDFVTRMKTYGLGKPCICFNCYAVFDRIDSHIAHKHYSRGTDEFIEMLKTFRRKTEKILFGKNSFPKDRKHNLKDKLKAIQNLDGEMSDNEVQNPSFRKQPSQPHPHSTHTQSKALSFQTSSSSYSSHSMSKAPSTSQALSSHTSSSYSSHTISKAPSTSKALSSHTSSSSHTQSRASQSSEAKHSSQISTVSSSEPQNISIPKDTSRARLRGKSVTPSKAQRRVLLKHKIEIDAQFRKTHRLQNRSEFRYYYNDANTILSDFKNYLIVQLSHNKKNSDQYANNVRQVWASVDPNRQIFPKNILQDPDAIEDYFYQPLYVSLKLNLKLPKEEQSPHVQAATIKSKLCSMNVFLRFLLNRGIFINLRADEINRMAMKIQELCASLKTSIDKREKLIAKIKSETLITVKNFQDFGSSNHVRSINQTLKNMSLSRAKSVEMKISKQSAIDIRDYLMVSLTYFNCLRASNLMNISLQDVNKITKHEEIDGAYVLVNEEYKVSMLYGAKIILLDSILYEQLKLYIEVYRPIVSNDSKLHDQNRYVFASSRITTTKPLGQKMDHSAISNAMTSAFSKAKVLVCSRILFQNKNVGVTRDSKSGKVEHI